MNRKALVFAGLGVLLDIVAFVVIIATVTILGPILF